MVLSQVFGKIYKTNITEYIGLYVDKKNEIWRYLSNGQSSIKIYYFNNLRNGIAQFLG